VFCADAGMASVTHIAALESVSVFRIDMPLSDETLLVTSTAPAYRAVAARVVRQFAAVPVGRRS
jgi:hypothetical protein